MRLELIGNSFLFPPIMVEHGKFLLGNVRVQERGEESNCFRTALGAVGDHPQNPGPGHIGPFLAMVSWDLHFHDGVAPAKPLDQARLDVDRQAEEEIGAATM